MIELNMEVSSKEFKKGWKAAKEHEKGKMKRIDELEAKVKDSRQEISELCRLVKYYEEEFEKLTQKETLDPETKASIERGMEDVKEGRVKPFKDVEDV